MNSITSPLNNYEIPVYVYEWRAWSNYLFPSINKNAIRIEAKIRQSNRAILKKIVAGNGYFLFHINLTKTAFFFRDKAELLTVLKYKGIIPLNGDVHDTSKKYLQSVCELLGLNTTKAFVSGDENELLIIKTNFNYGGNQEKKLLRSDLRRLNITSRDYDTNIIYPVTERKKIKNEVWDNENLIVEKYIANRDNFIYRVYKLLNKVVITEVTEKGLIKKMITAEKRTNYYYELNRNEVAPGGNLQFADLLTAILSLCSAMRIDFAAIDVVKSDENKYYIIDVNVTPNWNRTDQTEKLNFLGSGLSASYLLP